MSATLVFFYSVSLGPRALERCDKAVKFGTVVEHGLEGHLTEFGVHLSKGCGLDGMHLLF